MGAGPLASKPLTCGPSASQMSPYDNLLLCQPVSSPLPLRYVPRFGSFDDPRHGRCQAGGPCCRGLCRLGQWLGDGPVTRPPPRRCPQWCQLPAAAAESGTRAGRHAAAGRAHGAQTARPLAAAGPAHQRLRGPRLRECPRPRPRLFFWVPQPCLNRPLGGLLSLLLGHSLQGHRAPMGALLRSPPPTMS